MAFVKYSARLIDQFPPTKVSHRSWPGRHLLINAIVHRTKQTIEINWKITDYWSSYGIFMTTSTTLISNYCSNEVPIVI